MKNGRKKFRSLSSCSQSAPRDIFARRFYSTHKFFYVYLITNNITGENYVGKHYGTADNRYMGSGKKLKLAFEKYGRKNFRKDIVAFYYDWEQLAYAEKVWIKYFKSIGKAEYNSYIPK